MGAFLSLAKSRGMGALLTSVCATGGGAFKFELDFKRVNIYVNNTFAISFTLIISLTYFLFFNFFLLFFSQEVNLRLTKLDELDALIAGILYIDTLSSTECYYYASSKENETLQNETTPVSFFFEYY